MRERISRPVSASHTFTVCLPADDALAVGLNATVAPGVPLEGSSGPSRVPHRGVDPDDAFAVGAEGHAGRVVMLLCPLTGSNKARPVSASHALISPAWRLTMRLPSGLNATCDADPCVP